MIQPKRTSKKSDKPTLHVLDTNVLMHDPSALFRFQEHDVYLPMVTLEELDSHKRGMTEVSRNVRQVSRDLDALLAKEVSKKSAELSQGILLEGLGHTEASGRLFFQTNLADAKLPEGLPDGKADNQILGVVQALRKQFPGRNVVLVTKDINMRIKSYALGITAEDYRNDKVLEDTDLLYTGSMLLPKNFWITANDVEWEAKRSECTLRSTECAKMHVNQFVFFDDAEDAKANFHAIVKDVSGDSARLRRLTNYAKEKKGIFGIYPRNKEQNFALNLLLDPDCDFITLTGTAGTGKTLMTLAAALEQVIELRRYAEIIVTRVTVPMGDDIGFLPGTEEEKMKPWMGALEDNLEVLYHNEQQNGQWGRTAKSDLINSKIKIKSLNFMRGRTFLNKFVIIDEAQNLTPKQMKTLVTRAGPGTKIVCLGNLAQIDTPYLTEGSSGLTHAVENFKGWPHNGHIMLERGERSRLADHANEVL